MRGWSGLTFKASVQVVGDGAGLLQPKANAARIMAIDISPQPEPFSRYRRNAKSVLMRMFVSGAGGDHAAMGDFADGVLELDGGVMNVEA